MGLLARRGVPLALVGIVLAGSSARAQPAARDPVAEVGALVRGAEKPGDVFAFLSRLGQLGDLDLDRAQLARALSAGGGPGSFGPLAQLLGPASRVRVQNGQVDIERDEATTTPLFDRGHVGAGPHVRYRVRPDGRLEDVQGLQAGRRAEGLYDVKSVDVRRDPSGTGTARVIAGAGPVTDSVELPVSAALAPALPPAAPDPTPTAAGPPAPGGNTTVNTPGLAGVLDNRPGTPIDISRLPLTGRSYKRRRGSPRADVGVRTLPAIDIKGKSARPLGFSSGMTIDADGAGGAHRGDRTGQRKTSLSSRDSRGREVFLNPSTTPYVALPKGFERNHPGVKLGDIVAVQRNGRTAYAIYGDRGPSDQLGEGSIALARELGATPAQLNPNTGGIGDGVTYVVFPGSGDGRPLSTEEIRARGARLHAAANAAMRAR